MKRRILTTTVFLLATIVGTAFVTQTQAQRQANAANAANYTLSGPYAHKNLTIFLIHGKDQTTGKPPLTLQEAMKQKKVLVRETGDVNELTIQNRSQEEVFVQAGDIVKGGQQDRVLALDLILPPKSGRIAIDAFCVEHSRWSQRGEEAVTAFSASDKMLSTRGLKLAARNSRSQEEVWQNVSVAQDKLAKNYVASKGIPGGGPTSVSGGVLAGGGSGHGAGTVSNNGGGNVALYGSRATTEWPAGLSANARQNAIRVSPNMVYTPNAGLTLAEQQGLTSVISRVSPTSLQLTLENQNVKDLSTAYAKQLASIIDGKKDVIGYVFAINGQMNSADVYSSNALFKKLWPKLLDASAIEAFAELDQAASSEPVTAEAAKAFLRDAETGKAEAKNLRPRTKMVKRESEKNLLFETRNRNRAAVWLHRSYLAK